MVVKRVRDLKEFRADSELKRCYQVFGALVAGDDEFAESCVDLKDKKFPEV